MATRAVLRGATRKAPLGMAIGDGAPEQQGFHADHPDVAEGSGAQVQASGQCWDWITAAARATSGPVWIVRRPDELPGRLTLHCSGRV